MVLVADHSPFLSPFYEDPFEMDRLIFESRSTRVRNGTAREAKLRKEKARACRQRDKGGATRHFTAEESSAYASVGTACRSAQVPPPWRVAHAKRDSRMGRAGRVLRSGVSGGRERWALAAWRCRALATVRRSNGCTATTPRPPRAVLDASFGTA
ncbi:hypothetical protein MRX96_042638 [Rhipicephalus microplus]